MSTSTVDLPDAPDATLETPVRRGAQARDRAAAHALAADIARVHGPALLRTARRHSTCADDAHDAYQRALELLLRHAATIDRAKAVPWMHVVVRREAGHVRAARGTTVPLDSDEVETLFERLSTTPDEQLHRIDLAHRAGEALAALKESEAQALCLRAQGLSYEEIADAYGWSYTKVNRAVNEGRIAFRRHYRAVEEGSVCETTGDLISRFAAGELSARAAVKVRSHLVRCTACRSLLHAERQAAAGLHALLPPAVVASGEGVRSGWLHDHLLAPLTDLAGRLQPAAEHLTNGKLAVVAASTIAIAGGGVAGEQHAHTSAPTPKLERAFSTAASKATSSPLTGTGTDSSVATVVTGAADRSADLAAAARRRAAAKQKAAAKRRAAVAARAAKHEFSPAGGEFTASTKSASRQAERLSSGTSGSAPPAEVAIDDGSSASTVDVAPDTGSGGAPAGAVSDEFGP